MFLAILTALLRARNVGYYDGLQYAIERVSSSLPEPSTPASGPFGCTWPPPADVRGDEYVSGAGRPWRIVLAERSAGAA
jgi:hypothetical protein